MFIFAFSDYHSFFDFSWLRSRVTVAILAAAGFKPVCDSPVRNKRIINIPWPIRDNKSVCNTTGNETTAATNLKTASGATILAGTPFKGNIGNFGGGDVALNKS
ncbi:MAG: hypothetical protein SGI83_07195 [Bacteroidota bacterium]|nr:hypothetical protein [Bacteroidota bacterium]